MSSLVRVLEVGGTHVTAATVDVVELRVRERTRRTLDSAGTATSILASLHDAAMALADTVPTRWAVAMPDPFDYARGIGLFRDVGKFDALYGVDVGSALVEAITPRPRGLTFAHDTEAFLVGEWLCGAARGARRCAAITLGTGIGSAFLEDGTIVRTACGLPPDGRIHRVHVDGAPLEDSVSRRAIRATYAARTGRPDDIDVLAIAELARTGDRVAAGVLADSFSALGRALAPVLRTFAPGVLVVGGSIARSWDLLIGPLRSGLAEGGVDGTDIRPAEHEGDAAVIGAARHAIAPTPMRSKRASGTRASGTRAAVARALAAPNLVDRLAAYYANDSDTCGTNFLDGTEAQSPTTITAADLFAVTALGLTVPPRVARTLLRDTTAAGGIGRCLDRLPVDVPLDEATPELLRAMRDLYDAAVVAVDGSANLADALCARKRPELFPALTDETRDALRLPRGSAQTCWHEMRSVLSDPRLRANLERAFAVVRRRGVVADVYPLRQICVVLAVSGDCS